MVGELNNSLGGQHDVDGPDVAVVDLIALEQVEYAHEAVQDVPDLGLGEELLSGVALIQLLLQGVGEVLHVEGHLAEVAADVGLRVLVEGDHAHQVGVLQLQARRALLQEGLEVRVGVGGLALDENLVVRGLLAVDQDVAEARVVGLADVLVVGGELADEVLGLLFTLGLAHFVIKFICKDLFVGKRVLNLTEQPEDKRGGENQPREALNKI